MAFEDDFIRYIDQIKVRLPHIQGEEATKQSLIIPLFHILGYDVWNPLEVQPEYGSDFSRGARKGQQEKVDYALKINGEPVIFVECKAADIELNAHDGQLARYFNATPSVRVGVLTNGVRIKVFTDLQQSNIMDDKPWMDFDIRTPKQAEIDALKNFRKTEFAANRIVDLAEEMVYYNVLVPFIASQLIDPGERLVRLVAEEIPSLKRIDKKVVEKLTPILRKAIQAAILDNVARSFSVPLQQTEQPIAMAHHEPQKSSIPAEEKSTPAEKGITTTTHELDIYERICRIIKNELPDSEIQYKDAKSYFTILQKNIRKWFIRLNVEKDPNWISFRHIKPEVAQTLCPGITATDGRQNGASLVFITQKTDISSLKNLILASYRAEADRVSDPSDLMETK
jgi:hypothetical protein